MAIAGCTSAGTADKSGDAGVQPSDPNETPMIFRVPIDDVFDIRGRGVVVVGVIESGTVRVGERLQVKGRLPPVRVSVAAMEKFQKPNVEEAGAGEQVGVQLEGITRDQVKAGDVLCSLEGSW